MIRFSTAIAAALLVTAAATPVFAQAAIQEPGAYAFYHPNADVLAGRYAYRPPESAYAHYEMAPMRYAQPRYRSAAPRHRQMVR